MSLKGTQDIYYYTSEIGEVETGRNERIQNSIPSFEKSSFDLQVPRLDPSMARRPKEVRGGEARKSGGEREVPGHGSIQEFGHRQAAPVRVGKCRYSSRSRPPYGKRGLISLALLGATPSTTSPFRGERTSCDRRKFLVAVAGIHPIQTEGMCPSLRPYLSQRFDEGRFRLPEALALGLPGGQPFTSTSIRHGKVSIHGVKGGRSGSDSGFNLHGSFNKRGAKGSFNRNSMSVSSKILATPFFVRPPVVLSMVGGRV